MNPLFRTFARLSSLALVLVSCESDIEYVQRQEVKIPEAGPKTVAYVSGESQKGWEIYVAVDVNATYRLTFGGLNTAPGWSPDKHWIAYERNLPGPKTTIWRMRANGDEKRMLTSPDLESELPRYSPVGTKILFHQEHDYRIDVYIMDSTGANLRQITTPETVPLWNQSWFWLADWSPDGKMVIFCIWRTDKPKPNSSLAILSLETGAFTTLARLDSLVPMFPRWSPTRQEIAFVGIVGGAVSDFDIYRANIDGTDVMRLTDTKAARDPDWSPDGETIAYTRIETVTNSRSIWIVDREGKNPRPLLSSPYFSCGSPSF